ncbi:MAG: YtxH domain-containing protein [Coriobacteriia bacterium]|nr:YtxH domain-containing protein [Coriobacteriia bacterium]
MGRLTTLIVGGLVGAGLALAYAPRSGAETREKVSQKVNQAWENAQARTAAEPEEREYQEVPVTDAFVAEEEPLADDFAEPIVSEVEPVEAADQEPAEPQDEIPAEPAAEPVVEPAQNPRAAAEEAFAQGAQQLRDFAQQAATKGQEFAQAAAQHAPEIAARASEYAHQAVEGVMAGGATDDELRARIEAARARIAAQVMKNAQEDVEAVTESAPEPAVQVEAEEAAAQAEPVSPEAE